MPRESVHQRWTPHLSSYLQAIALETPVHLPADLRMPPKEGYSQMEPAHLELLPVVPAAWHGMLQGLMFPALGVRSAESVPGIQSCAAGQAPGTCRSRAFTFCASQWHQGASTGTFSCWQGGGGSGSMKQPQRASCEHLLLPQRSCAARSPFPGCCMDPGTGACCKWPYPAGSWGGRLGFCSQPVLYGRRLLSWPAPAPLLFRSKWMPYG